MTKKITILSESEAGEMAVQYRTLWEALNTTTKMAKPIGDALKKWIGENGPVGAEGQPDLITEVVNSGTDWDIKSIAEQDAPLLQRLAELGVLRGDTKAINAAIAGGMIAWPTQNGRKLYAMPKATTKMKWADEKE